MGKTFVPVNRSITLWNDPYMPVYLDTDVTGAYSEPCQTSKMKRFAKIACGY